MIMIITCLVRAGLIFFVSMATGGRHIQTRLIEPNTSLMNSGDVFVLVTPKYVHQWNGKNCSIMEKARVSGFSYTKKIIYVFFI